MAANSPLGPRLARENAPDSGMTFHGYYEGRIYYHGFEDCQLASPDLPELVNPAYLLGNVTAQPNKRQRPRYRDGPSEIRQAFVREHAIFWVDDNTQSRRASWSWDQRGWSDV